MIGKGVPSSKLILSVRSKLATLLQIVGVVLK